MKQKNIEKFFLNSLLKITITGIVLILLADVMLYPKDTLSISIDCIVLAAAIISYALRKRYPTVSVLILTLVALASMFYQCMAVPINTNTSISIILIVGFIFSIMLKERLLMIMHIFTFVSLNLIFAIQTWYLHFFDEISEMLSIAFTYSILYIILAYTTAILKRSYDRAHHNLYYANLELQQKADEIEAQNEELVQAQNNLAALNNELERLVEERTLKLREKTRKIIQYSYANAHHLRGPIARLLGLVTVYKLDSNPDHHFLFEKIETEAVEIDNIVRQINLNLEAGENME